MSTFLYNSLRLFFFFTELQQNKLNSKERNRFCRKLYRYSFFFSLLLTIEMKKLSPNALIKSKKLSDKVLYLKNGVTIPVVKCFCLKLFFFFFKTQYSKTNTHFAKNISINTNIYYYLIKFNSFRNRRRMYFLQNTHVLNPWNLRQQLRI